MGLLKHRVGCLNSAKRMEQNFVVWHQTKSTNNNSNQNREHNRRRADTTWTTNKNIVYICFTNIYPAFRTAPVQLNDAAAVPVAFALYGDAMTLSPSSSSDTAVVKLIRSSSEIYKSRPVIPRRKNPHFFFIWSQWKSNGEINIKEKQKWIGCEKERKRKREMELEHSE